MTRKDSFGVKVEVGDIVLSSPNGGGAEVGRVEKVHPSSRVTIKYAREVPIYAFEEGAPDIEATTTRIKRDENGRPVTVPDPSGRKDYRGNPYMVYEHEEYTYTHKDYTKVGRKWKWEKKQAADLALIVLRKKGFEAGLDHLHQAMNLDYDAKDPEVSV